MQDANHMRAREVVAFILKEKPQIYIKTPVQKLQKMIDSCDAFNVDLSREFATDDNEHGVTIYADVYKPFAFTTYTFYGVIVPNRKRPVNYIQFYIQEEKDNSIYCYLAPAIMTQIHFDPKRLPRATTINRRREGGVEFKHEPYKSREESRRHQQFGAAFSSAEQSQFGSLDQYQFGTAFSQPFGGPEQQFGSAFSGPFTGPEQPQIVSTVEPRIVILDDESDIVIEKPKEKRQREESEVVIEEVQKKTKDDDDDVVASALAEASQNDSIVARRDRRRRFYDAFERRLEKNIRETLKGGPSFDPEAKNIELAVTVIVREK